MLEHSIKIIYQFSINIAVWLLLYESINKLKPAPCGKLLEAIPKADSHHGITMVHTLFEHSMFSAFITCGMKKVQIRF